VTTEETATIREAARHWAIRVHDPSFAEWEAFAAWLEQAPAHLAAYEAALEEDRWADERLRAVAPPLPFTEPVEPMRPRRRWALTGSAAAAAVSAVIGGWVIFDRQPAMQEVATAPGEHRAIMLADGSRVTLNGGTRLSFAADQPRKIELLTGEALFDVRHDASAPFVVTVGATRLVDVGTVFNVLRQGDALDVAVARGAVIYAPGKDQIRLDAGAGLSRSSADARPIVRRANAESIGSWQAGRLQYDDAPLAQVARDLGRNLGMPIRIAGVTDQLRFTGTLVLNGTPEQVLARAGPLLGVRFKHGTDGWTMAPGDAPPH
jgi:transmembrane sensor